MIDPDGRKLAIKPISDVEFKGESPLRKMGTYLIVAKKRGGFVTKTSKGYKFQSKKSLKNVIKCSYSEKCGKAIVNVEKGSGNFSKIVGHALEIVPLKDPTNLRVGDYLPVKVMFKGQPLEYTLVYSTYAGFSTAGPHEYVYAYTTKTNKEGVSKIRYYAIHNSSFDNFLFSAGHFKMQHFRDVVVGSKQLYVADTSAYFA